MPTSSFGITLKFGTKQRRLLCTSDQDNAHDVWHDMRDAIDRIAKECDNENDFWSKVNGCIIEHGFTQVHE